MMRRSRSGKVTVSLAVAIAGVALLIGPAVPALAARVEGLYAATVPLADSSAESLHAAYAQALGQVLVKVTGSPEAGSDSRLARQLGDPQRLVQQFRRNADGSLWAQFDPVAIRRGLDAAGQPVWGEERPLTLVWLAFDAGAGERDIVGSEAIATTLNPTAVADTADRLRQELLRAASERGVPLVLPLRDSQDLAAVAFADVWGDFSDRLLAASQRYQPDAVLVGRAQLSAPGGPDVRWALHLGPDVLEWRGSVGDGPAGLADRLAARLATKGAADQSVLVAVTGVTGMDSYGQVTGYLRGIGIVNGLEVPFVSGDSIIYRLRVRGGREQLQQALALARLLRPSPSSTVDVPVAGRPADLVYRFAAGP